MQSLLQFASNIAVPLWVLGFALLIVIGAFWQIRRAQIAIPGWAFSAALAAIVLFGFCPFAATRYLESQGIHYVALEVLDPNGHRVTNAAVNASIPGDLQKSGNGWKLRIPPENLPADRKVTFSAAQDSAQLAGAKTIALGSDYFPSATIQLVNLPPAKIRGIVLDKDGKPVAGAFITLVDYPTIATSGPDGTFEIPTHASADQAITVRAQKGSTSTATSGTVGEKITLRFRQ